MATVGYCMLVHSADDTNVSGMTTNVPRDPAAALNGRVAFGANAVHEFSHAFGFLSDEYIDGRDRTNDRRDPRPAQRLDPVEPHVLRPRRHRALGAPGPHRPLPPHRRRRRPLTDGTYTDEHGATLRDTDRFCAWCQEIVTIRIHEKTDLLARPGDPTDPTAQGRTWYLLWTGELRDNYHPALGVAQQIRDAEARYATLAPGAHGEPLWRSDLYRVPAASTTQVSGPVTDLDDSETHLLTGYTAIP
jgi:hypothetical protein